MKPGPNPVKGYFYIGSAAFLWGVSATLGRAAFTGHLLPGGASLRNIDPLDPVAEPRDFVAGSAAFCVARSQRRVGFARSGA